MKLWYLGDSILSSQIAQVATDLGMELVDSSIENATMEQVWTEQVHESTFRAKNKPDCIAILFVNNPDYDAEVIIQVLLQRITTASKIVLAVYPADAKAIEGMTAHWSGDRFKTVQLTSLDNVVQAITQTLT